MYKAMFRIYIILMQILLPLWSVFVDPHNFADPKHWYKDKYYIPWDFFYYEIHLLAFEDANPTVVSITDLVQGDAGIF